MKKIIILLVAAFAMMSCGNTPQKAPTADDMRAKAWQEIAIECKKIYAQQFNAELLPLEQREWYEKSGLGIHYMYIGEIVHVWKK